MTARHVVLATLLVSFAGTVVVGVAFAGDERARGALPDARRRMYLVVVDRTDMLVRVDQLMEGVNALESLTDDVVSYEAQRAIDQHLGLMRTALRRARRSLKSARSFERRPVIATRRVPMARPQFLRFLESVRRAPFAGDKVDVVRDTAHHAFFTAGQAAQVVGSVQAWGQVDAAAALFPRVVDPEQFHVVYDALIFRSAREKLRRRVGGEEHLQRRLGDSRPDGSPPERRAGHPVSSPR